ncbi:MAG TPA: hypothetical protein VJ228_13500 [Candidatus Acidoferrales bacterium]|jgi:UDP-GlcNAc:undecaprenyl-phosphate GlcNAc-1-phosphate transferase|nr:hypothetical protein [Candidatus Acidoferrales bacterium]
MGDSGSEVLGFSVAFLGLDFIATKGASNASPLLAFPLLVAALPLFDAILTILRRLESGRCPFHGDRRYFYDLRRRRDDPEASGAYLLPADGVAGGIRMSCHHG